MKKVDFKNPVLMSRLRNIYFWLGSIAVILAAAGLDGSITTWFDFVERILTIPQDPMRLLATVTALLGVWVAPNTDGFRD